MIEYWNEVVKPNDLVYHLGDFCFRNRFDAKHYADKLNGKKILIKGNHDKIKQDYRDSFAEIHDLFGLNINKKLIVMCHYSMRSWPKSHSGSLHVFGHSHAKLPGYGRSMDVGVDTNNFYPYNLDEVIEKLEAIEIFQK